MRVDLICPWARSGCPSGKHCPEGKDCPKDWLPKVQWNCWLTATAAGTNFLSDRNQSDHQIECRLTKGEHMSKSCFEYCFVLPLGKKRMP